MIACLLLAGSGCASSNSGQRPAATPSTSATSISLLPDVPAPAASDCHPGSWKGYGQEFQGTMAGGELWALVFGPMPLQAGREYKIVWRMTGAGDFSIGARNEHNVSARLIWGPDRHDGSSFVHPGGEWGTGLVFPASGCWRVRTARDRAFGEALLQVVPA